MRPQYDYHKRENLTSWQLVHINVLLEDAKNYKNSSLIFYAALEARTILEKTEFDLILMSTDESQWGEVVQLTKRKNGLSQGNNKYKSLKYKYQSFSEALTKVVLNFSLGAYDYRTSEDFQHRLSDYIHIYTKTDKELEFDGPYIQLGIKTINETVEFIKSFYISQDDGYVYGMLNFSTLSQPMKELFESWKADILNNTEDLYLKIKKINDEENGGAKAKLVK